MRFSMDNTSTLLMTLLMLIGISACNSEPKVIEAEPASPHRELDTRVKTQGDMHEVEVLDLLHTDKYTYLDVKEEDQRYWIAVSKMEAEKGEKFMYQGGLLKKNFYSREFDRNFETIYLVSRLLPVGGSVEGSAMERAKASLGEEQGTSDINVTQPEGSIGLKELFSDPDRYAGQTIMVKGQCVKVNNRIMDRNWVHIQDGSVQDGEKLDLTLTTQENVPVGAIALFKGLITTKKDFGAGYRYEVLMEDAVVIQE